jgi:beta-fructofuranosidase
VLRLDDHWVWDFWLARDDADYHVFFLKAPRSLGNPDLRHWHARIGHAVSRDLRGWEVLPDALGPGAPGSFDDLATWTGSVLTSGGRHYLYYTGIGRRDGGRVQRIGLAVSDDLTRWERVRPDAPILEADPRWYELLDEGVWHEESWRDPWVFEDPESGAFHMLLTARVNHGSPDGRGVIGQARSHDLLRWEVMAPLTEPGEFGHLECPQVVAAAGRHYLLFSVCDWAHSKARTARTEPVHGTHYLVGDSPTGPFRSLTDTFLCGSPEGLVYAGKIIEDPGGALVFLAFEQHDERGRFLGRLADPVPVEVLTDGRLQLSAPP